MSTPSQTLAPAAVGKSLPAPGGGMLSWAGSVAVFLGIMALWWIASHAGWISKVFLPTPEATWLSLRDGWMRASCWLTAGPR